VPSRVPPIRSQPGFSLPFFERLAPPPPPGLIAARIDAATAPGDVVLDLAGRGGWVARAAVDRQRRAVSLESSPLTRLLAELVLRPPDLRHLDAAFQAMSASPHGQTSLKNAVGELFATRCATCGRPLTLDDVIWTSEDADVAPSAAARKQYACPVCRGTRGSVQRSADVDEDDLARARALPEGYGAIRARLRDRFRLALWCEAPQHLHRQWSGRVADQALGVDRHAVHPHLKFHPGIGHRSFMPRGRWVDGSRHVLRVVSGVSRWNAVFCCCSS